MKNHYFEGMRDSLPVCVAYLAVSFGLGILCAKSGISLWQAAGISAVNLTSAGQAAGIAIIAAGGSLLEMAATQFVINLRYSLMGLTLSQKLAPSFSTGHRLLCSFGITDELFALAVARKQPLTPSYMYGLMTLPILCWTAGTLIGGAAGEILPPSLTNAFGVLLYGMFIAIIVPPARTNRALLVCELAAASLSCLFYYFVPGLSSGFSVILCSLLACIPLAALRPIPDEEEDGEGASEPIQEPEPVGKEQTR